MQRVIVSVFISLFLISCVSQKQLDEVVQRLDGVESTAYTAKACCENNKETINRIYNKIMSK